MSDDLLGPLRVALEATKFGDEPERVDVINAAVAWVDAARDALSASVEGRAALQIALHDADPECNEFGEPE